MAQGDSFVFSNSYTVSAGNTKTVTISPPTGEHVLVKSLFISLDNNSSETTEDVAIVHTVDWNQYGVSAVSGANIVRVNGDPPSLTSDSVQKEIVINDTDTLTLVIDTSNNSADATCTVTGVVIK